MDDAHLHDLDSSAVIDGLGTLFGSFRAQWGKKKYKPLVAELEKWERRLAQIRREASAPSDLTIALLGESGAGKSSLINALLEVDLLPSASGRAVTSAVTAVRASGTDYTIRLDLTPKPQYLEGFRGLLGRLRDAYADAAKEDKGATAVIDEGDDTHARAVSGRDTAALARHAATHDAETMLLPDVLALLNAGPTVTRTFSLADPDAVRRACRDYLGAHGSLWPLVQRAELAGPFAPLHGGVRLLDVPGLNDPDPVRTAIAHDALGRAQRIWLVVSAQRAMTATLVEYLRRERLLVRLASEGQLSSLCVVATHADQCNDQPLFDSGEAAPDAPAPTLRLAHRQHVAQAVADSLVRVWRDTANASAGVEPATIADGEQILRGVPVFLVSSTDHLLHVSGDRAKRRPTCANIADTGIHQLQHWVREEFPAQTRRATQRRTSTAAARLQKDVIEQLRRLEATARKRATGRRGQEGGLKALHREASEFLATKLLEQRAIAQAQLQAGVGRMRTAQEVAKTRAREVVRHEMERLDGMHWATLRAVVRRDGVFTAQSRKHYDIPGAIVKAVVDAVVFRWIELCEQVVQDSLNALTAGAEQALDECLYRLHAAAQGMTSVAKQPPQLDLQHTQPATGLAGAGRSDIATRLRRPAATLERDLDGCVRTCLRPAFRRVANEHGIGMKRAILSGLAQAMPGISHDVERVLDRQFAEKTDEIQNAFSEGAQQLQAGVRSAANAEAAALATLVSELTPEELAAEADELEQCVTALAALLVHA